MAEERTEKDAGDIDANSLLLAETTRQRAMGVTSAAEAANVYSSLVAATVASVLQEPSTPLFVE